MPPSDRYERQLGFWWNRVNTRVFGGALLASPRILLDRALEVNALWDPTEATIRVSRQFVRAKSWWCVVEVLKYEMAHQYVSDVIGARDESERREVHQMVCERFGLCGVPPRDACDAGLDAHLQELKALLAGGDPASDAAAMTLAKSIVPAPDTLLEGTKAFSARAVGPASITVEQHERSLARFLVRLLGVECRWVGSLDPAGHDAQQLEVMGRLPHVRAAERLQSVILEEAGRRWTMRGAGRGGNWLRFMVTMIDGFERAVPGTRPANGTVETRDAELIDFCSRRHRGDERPGPT
ncbi:MAG TPA: hypothetical protein VFQ61_08555 [Polyangiaceae bacterium]|nr:hypothetical protein [Polyangiaceae bacterium]